MQPTAGRRAILGLLLVVLPSILDCAATVLIKKAAHGARRKHEEGGGRKYSVPRLSCYTSWNNPPVAKLHPVRDVCSHFMLIGSATISANGSLLAPPTSTLQEYQSLGSAASFLLTITAPNPHWSLLTSSHTLMENFANDSLKILEQSNWNGIDLDWEFPVWSSDARPDDKRGLILLLQHLRKRLGSKLLISIAVPAPFDIVDKGYDAREIGRLVDLVQIMNYDFHVFHKTTPFVGFNAPLHAMPVEVGPLGKMNSEFSTKHWIDIGLPREKILFGIPTYGRGYRLLSSHLHLPYSPATSAVTDLGFQDVLTLLSLRKQSIVV